jgi:hypothetical protein
MFDQPASSSSDAAVTTADQQQLLRLNADFLHLLNGNSASGSGASRPQQNLAPPQVSRLTQCSVDGIQRMARCGFSLFSLSLHRPDLWQRALTRNTVQDDCQHYGVSVGQDTTDQIRTGFMECTLFFAWHLAQQRPRDARFMLGMSEDCAKLIAGMELWQCRQLAQTQTHLLEPRWVRHPYFWNDLLQYGGSGDVQHFKFACLLGSQLMAQDLEPSAILHLSSTD